MLAVVVVDRVDIREQGVVGVVRPEVGHITVLVALPAVLRIILPTLQPILVAEAAVVVVVGKVLEIREVQDMVVMVALEL